ncbi:hypothetical protein CerSpe_176940 [Prunus speciosa]
MKPISLSSWWSQNYDILHTLLFVTLTTVIFSFWVLFIKKYKTTTTIPPLPPGPLGLPFIGNLLSLRPQLHSYFLGLAQAHGPIFRLLLGTKTCIIVSSPSFARHILKDHDITFANRDVPDAGRAATYGGSDIAWTPYGPEWRMLRKVCVLKMLNNTTLDSVYELRRRQIRKTVGYLYARVGSPSNVGEQAFLTMFNVVTNMLWGGTGEGDERAGLGVGAEFREVLSAMIELIGKPNVSDFYPGLARFDLQGIRKGVKRLVRRFDGIFEEMIDRRLRIEKEGGEESKDFLSFLLSLKDEVDSKTPLTMSHVKALLVDMVTGGNDTTTNTVEFAMAEVMNKPEVMQKAQQELDAVVGKHNIVEESHIHKLPYLQAVMKETLRLHPVVPLLIPHSPSETCTVGGYTIPKGSQVFINAWAIHRDPCNWENPLEFDPNRFLDGKWDYNGRDFTYLPFGSGKRICIGIAMAERMVMYLLATLLHSFDWRLPQGEELDLSEKFGLVLKKEVPLVAIPTPRLSDPALYE